MSIRFDKTPSFEIWHSAGVTADDCYLLHITSDQFYPKGPVAFHTFHRDTHQ